MFCSANGLHNLRWKIYTLYCNNLCILKNKSVLVCRIPSSVHHSDLTQISPMSLPHKSAKTRLARSSRLYDDGQEVRGRVFPAGFLPPHGFAVGVEPHEHVLLLVAPLCRGVGVVLVLLDAFDQAAVRPEVPLQRRRRRRLVSKVGKHAAQR